MLGKAALRQSLVTDVCLYWLSFVHRLLNLFWPHVPPRCRAVITCQLPHFGPYYSSQSAPIAEAIVSCVQSEGVGLRPAGGNPPLIVPAGTAEFVSCSPTDQSGSRSATVCCGIGLLASLQCIMSAYNPSVLLYITDALPVWPNLLLLQVCCNTISPHCETGGVKCATNF